MFWAAVKQLTENKKLQFSRKKLYLALCLQPPGKTNAVLNSPPLAKDKNKGPELGYGCSDGLSSHL